MQKAKYLILFFLANFFNLTYAQDLVNFTQFFFNPYTLNPSYAGIDGRGALFLTYRKQWSGIEGGPTIGNFSFHAPVKSGVSLGVNVANDKRGIVSNTGALFTVAYSASLGEFTYIRFGISGGGSWNTIDLDKIQNIGTDPALINLLNQSASVIGNVGLSIHAKSFHAGVSMPNMFTPSYVSGDAFTVTEVKPSQAFVFHASNRFYFADNKHVFEPYVVYRINNGLPSQYEAAAVLHLNHAVWLGGSYKQEYGISGFGGIKLNKTLAIGASYSLKNSGVNELNFPSYEVQLSYLGGASKAKSKSKTKSKPQTHIMPTYSFVDTEPKKLTAKEKQAQAKKKQQEELAKKEAEAKKVKEAEAKKAQEAEVKKAADAEVARKAAEAKVIQEEAARKKQQDELAKKEAETKKVQEAEANKVKQTDAEVKKAADAELASKAAEAKLIQEEVARKKQQEELAKKEAEVKATKPVDEKEVPKEKTLTTWMMTKDSTQEGRHETVTRGDHAQELEQGIHVIVGAFQSGSNARNLARKLVDTGFNANYGYLTEKGLWYVHVFVGDDINHAKEERDKYRRMPLFRNAWLLTVQN